MDVHVTGVVQGVGFRPFVHRAAAGRGLTGWVRNETGGVQIEVEGPAAALAGFLDDLRTRAPVLTRLEGVTARRVPPHGYGEFVVLPSETAVRGRLPVSPDVATCPACLEELFDPANRRHRYPFITCTDCGPRFTVIESMPYDRERSTMRAFTQCPECLREYRTPSERRYHSQTNSCPTCGPRLRLLGTGSTTVGEAALQAAGALLRDGWIVAIRGLGGFHLAVDAGNPHAVARLRTRKNRESKPLAVMVRSVADARRLAVVGPEEASLLESPRRPIVLVRRVMDAPLSEVVSPGLDTVGIMLAYTPLHHLLLEATDRPLVMTSGNLSEEPIAIANTEAQSRLTGVADAFLLHNREIVSRYDDSLMRVVDGAPVFLRRARGFAPTPLRLPYASPLPLLAVGPHLKNTLTLADGTRAFVSQHIGDLENLETLEHFQAVLDRYMALFRIAPEAVVADLHPGYLSTRIAEESGLRALQPVQHHHAHIAAVQAEHDVTGPVLGIAYDGTGYGADGRTWGAELMVSSLTGFRRLAHLRYAPLPGGDLAIRRPWRTALGYASLDPRALETLSGAWQGIPEAQLRIAQQQARSRLNAPEASSMGRLFDAAAAVLGVRQASLHEGQAPMELEALAGDRAADPLPFPSAPDESGLWVLDPVPLLEALAVRRLKGDDPGELAARFHESVAAATAELASRLCAAEALDTVALGGGVFQNARLLASVVRRLEAEKVTVLVPRALPPNDGSVSYGQAVVAAARLHGEANRDSR